MSGQSRPTTGVIEMLEDLEVLCNDVGCHDNCDGDCHKCIPVLNKRSLRKITNRKLYKQGSTIYNYLVLTNK
uniref:Uncharacterized protein n=1 Tax=viral metagenome TaxID=1070528 RepID=A0A6M3ME39_9ZZZZ